MDLLKIIANVTGLADFWSKYFGRQQEKKDDFAIQREATYSATLDTISQVAEPVSAAESQRLWDSNHEKYTEITDSPTKSPD